MTLDLDIYRSANLLVKQCRQDAPVHATMRADAMLERGDLDGYQAPLVRRHDLPEDLAKRLYWAVSAALRKHILANYDLDPTDIDETMEAAVNDAMGNKTDLVRERRTRPNSTEEICEQDLHVLIELLRKGEVSMFLDKFTSLSKLRLTLVRRLLFEPGGEGLAIACKGIGLDKATFVSIFIRFRQGRLGDKEVEAEELTRALLFFSQTGSDAARALMRRWQRDPDYLNALRQIEQTGSL